MKLDRNVSEGGRGKYALLKLRQLDLLETGGPFTETNPAVVKAMRMLEREGLIDYGAVNTESEFFVIRLKDCNALPALRAYSDSVRLRDPEFALEVSLLCNRAGSNSHFCKDPD